MPVEIIFDEQEFINQVNTLLGIFVEEKIIPVKKPEDVLVGISYIDFITSFKKYFPNIKLIRTPEEVEKFDLIIAPGGEDIDPGIYGESNKSSYTNPYRDNIEVPIIKRAMKLGKKLYGSCRGHQLINALNGGTLYQDFIDEMGVEKRHPAQHGLENISDTSIQKYFGDKPVISMHHQAVKRTPLRVTSTYNGIIESCYGKNIITTQFHPEFSSDNKEFFDYLLVWASSK